MSVVCEQIPVEVIAKFLESGTVRPLKLIYLDEIYVIDKIFGQRTLIPEGTHTTMQEFVCLINGKKKKIYFDKYRNVWYLLKSVQTDIPEYYLKYENC